MKATRLLALLLVPSALIGVQSCTDLTESPTSSITPDNFYRNEGEVLAGLASVYGQLQALTWSYYNLSQVTSDEIIVPTRGSDWYDNGRWLELDRQAWAPNSPAGLEDLGGAWNDLFQGVARANVVLGALEKININNKAQVQAELRALRALYYYLLMDFFGGVPIVTGPTIETKARATRDETFEFIESELQAALPDLPATWPAASHGRFTKGAANAILASMYVNAQVFKGTVSTTGLTPGAAMWTEAVAAADAVISSGQYSLAANWTSNFAADNSTSPENILVVKFAAQDGQGLNFVMRALHYNQFNPSPWNGFSTIAEVYNQFDAADPRRAIFLVGQAVNEDPKSPTFGQPVNNRQGQPLVFTTSIADVTQATEAEGARIMKWRPDPNHLNENNGNDFAFFRLAEMYLIKAEAQNELGQTAAAITTANIVRTRAFPGKPIAGGLTQAQLRDTIFAERLFEFTGEAKRRQDLIRAGKYTSLLYLNNMAARAPHRILMSIPQTQIDINPLLTQNPGY